MEPGSKKASEQQNKGGSHARASPYFVLNCDGIGNKLYHCRSGQLCGSCFISAGDMLRYSQANGISRAPETAARRLVCSHIIGEFNILQRPLTGDRNRYQHCLRWGLCPSQPKYLITLLHCGCTLLSHRSVERLYSASVSISELHPHIRFIRMLLALKPEAKGS